MAKKSKNREFPYCLFVGDGVYRAEVGVTLVSGAKGGETNAAGQTQLHVHALDVLLEVGALVGALAAHHALPVARAQVPRHRGDLGVNF